MYLVGTPRVVVIGRGGGAAEAALFSGRVVLAIGVLALAVPAGESAEEELAHLIGSLNGLAEGRILLTCQRGEGEWQGRRWRNACWLWGELVDLVGLRVEEKREEKLLWVDEMICRCVDEMVMRKCGGAPPFLYKVIRYHFTVTSTFGVQCCRCPACLEFPGY